MEESEPNYNDPCVLNRLGWLSIGFSQKDHSDYDNEHRIDKRMKMATQKLNELLREFEQFRDAMFNYKDTEEYKQYYRQYRAEIDFLEQLIRDNNNSIRREHAITDLETLGFGGSFKNRKKRKNRTKRKTTTKKRLTKRSHRKRTQSKRRTLRKRR